jgi:hypothetical protein
MAEDVEELEKAELESPAVAAQAYSSLPFILTLTALLLFFAFQTIQMLAERNNLAMVKSSQDAAIQEAQKVQAQFKNLVNKTKELADQGHAGAKMVMDELFQRGVESPPQAAAPQPMPPGKTEVMPQK